MTLEERERAAIAALRRLERRRAEVFQRVFVEVCRNARSSARTIAERSVWSDIEDAIRIDLRRE